MTWFPARIGWIVAGLIFLTRFSSAAGQDEITFTADSRPQQGVPKGEIKGPFKWTSKVFSGTVRDYWFYVPAQYDSAKPACTMVVQDGLHLAQAWKLPTVLDNLIHKKEIPVTIGVFINPGVVPAPHDNAQPRFNRSIEYDSLGDDYARFLLEEILPEAGKRYSLSRNPNDRLIAGASSGAICAFNVAWEHPDMFRRVFSAVGSYVSLRGGNEFPALVRKVEPKPLRVFLQDGSNDLQLFGGSWWVSNQDMLASLEWAGYDVKHAWDEGEHNPKYAAAILPDALRWIWRGYPEAVKVGTGAERWTELLIPGEDWRLVSQGHKFTEGPAVNDQGEVFFTDIPNNRIYKIGLDDEVTLFAEDTGKANGLMFDRDGRLYACAGKTKQIVCYGADGKAEVVATDVESNDLVVGQNGIYFTDPRNQRVCHIDEDSKVRTVDQGIAFPNGVILSPDQALLYVADTRGQFVYSYQVQPDGSLSHKQRFHHLHVAWDQNDSGADGMTVDTAGRLYVTSRMGVQVCDQAGRVQFIISKPQGGWLSNVVFGGPKLDTLYVTCGDKVFKRKIKAEGVVSWREPIKPPGAKL